MSTIEEIKIFSTIIVTADNKSIIIPNGQITSDAITNHSAKPTRRVDLTMGVGYDDDLKKAQAIMMKVMEDHPLVLQDPAPSMILKELADSSEAVRNIWFVLVRFVAPIGVFLILVLGLIEMFKELIGA